MSIGVCVAGATGSVGRTIVEAVLSRPQEFRLVSALTRRGKGQDVGTLVGRAPCGIVATDDIGAALDAGPQVLIDYTHPAAVRGHIDAAFRRGVSVVIGTTGFTDEDFAAIDAAARRASVGAATGNFAFTAALMQHLAKIAARHVPHWEIIEYAGAEKPDVPSGTARELAELLGHIRQPVHHLADSAVVGPRAALGASFGGARLHSVRLPGSPIAVEILFGLKGERLIMRHDEQDSSIFVTGSLLAAKQVLSRRGLVRGLDALLFEGPEAAAD